MRHLFLAEAKGQNMVFSPLSIHVVLSMIAASTKGPTQDELLSSLKSMSTGELNSLASNLISFVFADGSPSGSPCLSFANGVWVDKSLPLKPSFKEVVDTFYKAAQKHVDFQNKAEEARAEVNSWAEKETKGVIRKVLPPQAVDSSTRVIFANALLWEHIFSSPIRARHVEKKIISLIN
ncbi:hypothetical protein PRUPE_5G042200 [Prunus persica]|uniref:Serpin domain-containing protein n=1 Tax=Prunus persica TaxID=3760 RepID=A0A251P6W7_PRUPE|nr:hypothetical protein PRUPE_5G042200 [Prunus persica]